MQDLPVAHQVLQQLANGSEWLIRLTLGTWLSLLRMENILEKLKIFKKFYELFYVKPLQIIVVKK